MNEIFYILLCFKGPVVDIISCPSTILEDPDAPGCRENRFSCRHSSFIQIGYRIHISSLGKHNHFN